MVLADDDVARLANRWLGCRGFDDASQQSPPRDFAPKLPTALDEPGVDRGIGPVSADDLRGACPAGWQCNRRCLFVSLSEPLRSKLPLNPAGPLTAPGRVVPLMPPAYVEACAPRPCRIRHRHDRGHSTQSGRGRSQGHRLLEASRDVTGPPCPAVDPPAPEIFPVDRGRLCTDTRTRPLGRGISFRACFSMMNKTRGRNLLGREGVRGAAGPIGAVAKGAAVRAGPYPASETQQRQRGGEGFPQGRKLRRRSVTGGGLADGPRY